MTSIRKKWKPQIEAAKSAKERGDLRIQYWSELVIKAMSIMKDLNGEVAKFLIDRTGTRFLKMAYEEVCLPFDLFGKKKYLAGAHKDLPNFSEDAEPFIRGIDIVKQGKSAFIKNIGDIFIRTLLSPYNEKSVLELCNEIIAGVYNTKHDPQLFKQTASYKPNKRNIPVLTFIERMKKQKLLYPEQNIELPEPGEKFDYVCVTRDIAWTYRGMKVDLKKGDKMEFLSMYDPAIHVLDIDYYVDGEFVGLFARFLASVPSFHPPETLSPKETDAYIIRAATDYIKRQCAQYSSIDKESIKKRGLDNKRVYKEISKAVASDLQSRIPSCTNLFYEDTYLELPPHIRQPEYYQNIVTKLLETQNICKLYTHSSKVDKMVTAYLSTTHKSTLDWLFTNKGRLTEIVTLRSKRLEEAVIMARSAQTDNVLVDSVNKLNEEDINFMLDYENKRKKLQVLATLRNDQTQIMKLIKAERSKTQTVAFDARAEAKIDAACATPVRIMWS
jgi:hypothetical protein